MTMSSVLEAIIVLCGLASFCIASAGATSLSGFFKKRLNGLLTDSSLREPDKWKA